MEQKITKADIKAKWSGHTLMANKGITTYFDRKLGISISVTDTKDRNGLWRNKPTYRYRYIRDGEVREFKTLEELINDYNHNF